MLVTSPVQERCPQQVAPPPERLGPCPSGAQVELHEEEKKLIAQQQVEMQQSSDKPAELAATDSARHMAAS
jgi:hypothetical protein